MKAEKGLLRDIKQFLLQDKCLKKDTVISLCDFYDIINDELNEIREKYIDFDLDKVLKKSSIFTLNKGLIKTPYLSYWKINSNGSSVVCFEYNYRCYIEFVKDLNQDFATYNYYCSNIEEKTMRKFAQYHYDNILKMISLMEEYYKLIGGLSDLNCYRETLNNEIFNITLKIDNALLFSNEDMLRFKIKLNPNYQKSPELYYGNNFNKSKIHSFIRKSSFDILDRIYIDTTRISEPFNTIYQNYIKKQKAQKKQLIKK